MNSTATPGSGLTANSKGKVVDVVFEITLAEGVEAERLGLQQAAVIRDVVQWYRRNVTGASPDASTKYPL